MSSTSGVLIVPYQDTNYRLDNLAFSNVKTFENIVINRFFQLEPTGFNISGGSVPLSGFGATEIRTEILGEQCFRKNVITSNSLSGYVDIEFKWDSLNSQNQIVNFDRDEITSNTVNGYKVKIYDKYNNRLLKNYNLSTFTTGFNSTGLSGFAGDNTFTGYFFTGASGFAGASGVTGNGLTGEFNYVLVDTGANAYGLVESGFLVTQNTYIPISGTGASTIFGLKESGFNVTESGFNRNEFTFPAKDQYEIFNGENADFNLHIQNTTIGGVDFELSKRFKIIQPEIDDILFNLANDNVTVSLRSKSSTSVNIETSSGDSSYDYSDKFNSQTFNLSEDNDVVETFFNEPNKLINYTVTPEDQYSTGISVVTGFINNVFFSGLSISEVNVGTDPGTRLNWDIFDESTTGETSDSLNSNIYYQQKIQVFDPSRDGNNEIFDLSQEPILDYDYNQGIIISGGTGYGHGLSFYTVTGSGVGFGGISGVTGFDNSGEELIELIGPFTYELVPDAFSTGSSGELITGIYGIVESGVRVIDDLITRPLSEVVFDFSVLSGNSISSIPGNVADLSFKDCNIDSNEVGIFIWVNSIYNENDPCFITGELITGSVLRDYFINQSGFGLNTNGPYNINLSLGSGNSIQSSKSSPGEMKFISTDEQDESLDLMFANTSGFGTTLTGNVEISLGESNKIVSDGGGNIDFKSVSTGEAQEETSLFNITSDPDTPSIFRSDIQIHGPATGYGTTGHKLFFGTEEENTDSIYFARINTDLDSSVLRLHLGDNLQGSSHQDKFLVQATSSVDGSMNTLFSVDTRAQGNVGILTSTPAYPFHINSSYMHSSIARIHNSSQDGGGLHLETSSCANHPALLVKTRSDGIMFPSRNTFEIGTSGEFVIDYDTLPSADPGTRGQLYRDSNNFLKISAG